MTRKMTNSQSVHHVIALLIENYMDVGQPFNACAADIRFGAGWSGAGHTGKEDCAGCKQMLKLLCKQRDFHLRRSAIRDGGTT